MTSKAQAQETFPPATDGTAVAGIARSESGSPAAASRDATDDPRAREILLQLQRMLEVTRRFFEIKPITPAAPSRTVRSYPIPTPVAWRWCQRDGAAPDRWYHGEYPYGAAKARVPLRVK